MFFTADKNAPPTSQLHDFKYQPDPDKKYEILITASNGKKFIYHLSEFLNPYSTKKIITIIED